MSKEAGAGRPPLKPGEKPVPLQVLMPKEMREAFQAWCKRHGTTMSEQVREWIEEVLQEETE